MLDQIPDDVSLEGSVAFVLFLVSFFPSRRSSHRGECGFEYALPTPAGRSSTGRATRAEILTISHFFEPKTGGIQPPSPRGWFGAPGPVSRPLKTGRRRAAKRPKGSLSSSLEDKILLQIFHGSSAKHRVWRNHARSHRERFSRLRGLDPRPVDRRFGFRAARCFQLSRCRRLGLSSLRVRGVFTFERLPASPGLARVMYNNRRFRP